MTDAKYSLTPADRVEIHELPGRYGDAIDDRNWDALDTVFTEDAVFDLTGVGSRICEGLDDIESFMESEAAHPRTHMMTNIYADLCEQGVTMRFRIVALLGKGLTSTASYYDTIVKTDDVAGAPSTVMFQVGAATNAMQKLTAKALHVNA